GGCGGNDHEGRSLLLCAPCGRRFPPLPEGPHPRRNGPCCPCEEEGAGTARLGHPCRGYREDRSSSCGDARFCCRSSPWRSSDRRSTTEGEAAMSELAASPVRAAEASTVNCDRLDHVISRVAAGDRAAFRRLYAFMAMRVW